MTAALVFGAAAGLGFWLIVCGLWPPRPPLAAALRSLETPAANSPPRGTRTRLLGLAAAADEADLRVVGMSREEHAVERLAAVVGGVGLPIAGAWTLAVAGAPLSPATGILPGLLLGVTGWMLPGALLARRAAARRAEFTDALAGYLELVAILLAGGAGTESALQTATGDAAAWPFARLRAALDRAALVGETPWTSLARLGEQLGVSELVELGAASALAGEHGARVRRSLTARARGLRERRMAELETAAQTATEQMTVPMVLLAVGFLLFIGFPAVQQVLGGL